VWWHAWQVVQSTSFWGPVQAINFCVVWTSTLFLVPHPRAPFASCHSVLAHLRHVRDTCISYSLAQLLMFVCARQIPPHARALYVNLAFFSWTTYLSFIAYRFPSPD